MRGEFGGLIWHPEHLWLSDFSWCIQTYACIHTHARSAVAVCYSSWLLANELEKKNLQNQPVGGNVVILFEVLAQVRECLNAQSSMIFCSLKGPDDQDPKCCALRVSEDGAGLGEDRVKFPHLEPVRSGQPKPALPSSLYIVLMLLFSRVANGYSLATRISLPQTHQILWTEIKSGVKLWLFH